MSPRLIVSALAATVAGLAGCAGVNAAPPTALEGVPRYTHIVVIMEENKDFSQIMDPAVAPHINALAKTYGLALSLIHI